MRQEWDPEDLLAAWTLVEADWELIANKSGATRLGFALLLKFFELEACFPRSPSEVTGCRSIEPGVMGITPRPLALLATTDRARSTTQGLQGMGWFPRLWARGSGGEATQAT